MPALPIFPRYAYAYEALRALGFLANAQAKVLPSVEQVMQFVRDWEDKRHDLPWVPTAWSSR